MRELTKSMISYAWANSLFGVQQMMNVVSAPKGDQKNPVTAAFDSVSAAATAQLNPAMKSAFDSAEGMQRSMVNMMFEVMDPTRWMAMGNRMMDQTAMGARRVAQAGAEAMKQGATAATNAASTATGAASDAARQATTGFGPMPAK
jgi:hypothetical protein